MDNIRNELQDIFRDVFDNDELVLTDDMTADQVEGWDSLTHINLIIAIEKQFGVKFTTAEMTGQNGENRNIGTFLQLLAGKVESSREAYA